MAFPKIEGYVVTEKLGSGSYSTVYKAYNKVGGRVTVAVKCVDKGRVKHSGAAVDNLLTEIRLLRSLDHPHIVRMHNFTWDNRNIYIIMEYCNGGDLSRYIHRYGRVPETKVHYFLQQLAAALQFLHGKGIAHMDLKPHNLLLHKEASGRYILKVADFGFAQYMSAGGGGVRGSPLYMAPEMIAGRRAPTADLWSVGVILFECLFGRAPYSAASFRELVGRVQREEPIQIPPNSSISRGCRDLLLSLLRHSPEERIGYEEFFNHPYLDLEHMPSQENYEKAVSLMKQAVELDASGRLQAALDAYTLALRYLVPRARCEGDPVRRAALADKLARYMDRAEEIKVFLKTGQTVSTSNHLVPPPASHDVIGDDVVTVAEDGPACPACPAGAVPGGTEGTEGTGFTEGTVPPAERGARGARGGAPRRGLRRLLSLPFLDERGAPAASTSKPQKEEGDACRIT